MALHERETVTVDGAQGLLIRGRAAERLTPEHPSLLRLFSAIDGDTMQVAWQIEVDGNLDNTDADYQGKYAFSTCYNSEGAVNLAGMVGASRERVNKAIASFVRLRWIEQQDRRYRITNREELERRAR